MTICFHTAISQKRCLNVLNSITHAVYCTFSVRPNTLCNFMSSELYRITEIIAEVQTRKDQEGPEGSRG
jgi:hypothetical protein